jgi:hypothetical protein
MNSRKLPIPLDTPLEELGFTVRLDNCLKSEGFQSLRDVVSSTKKELLEIPNFGKGSLERLEAILWTNYGLTLNMKLPEPSQPIETTTLTNLQTAFEITSHQLLDACVIEDHEKAIKHLKLCFQLNRLINKLTP